MATIQDKSLGSGISRKGAVIPKTTQETIKKKLYSKAEDMLILHEVMETGRTWQSIKGRFFKISENDFAKYKLELSEAMIKRLRDKLKKKKFASSGSEDSEREENSNDKAVTRNTKNSLASSDDRESMNDTLESNGFDKTHKTANFENSTSKSLANYHLARNETPPKKRQKLSKTCGNKKIVQPECGPIPHISEESDSDVSVECISSDDDNSEEHPNNNFDSVASLPPAKRHTLTNHSKATELHDADSIIESGVTVNKSSISPNENQRHNVMLKENFVKTIENTSPNLCAPLGQNAKDIALANSVSTSTMEEEAVKYVRHIVRQSDSGNEEAEMLAKVTLMSLVQMNRHMKFILDDSQ